MGGFRNFANKLLQMTGLRDEREQDNFVYIKFDKNVPTSKYNVTFDVLRENINIPQGQNPNNNLPFVHGKNIGNFSVLWVCCNNGDENITKKFAAAWRGDNECTFFGPKSHSGIINSGFISVDQTDHSYEPEKVNFFYTMLLDIMYPHETEYTTYRIVLAHGSGKKLKYTAESVTDLQVHGYEAYTDKLTGKFSRYTSKYDRTSGRDQSDWFLGVTGDVLHGYDQIMKLRYNPVLKYRDSDSKDWLLTNSISKTRPILIRPTEINTFEIRFLEWD